MFTFLHLSRWVCPLGPTQRSWESLPTFCCAFLLSREMSSRNLLQCNCASTCKYELHSDNSFSLYSRVHLNAAHFTFVVMVCSAYFEHYIKSNQINSTSTKLMARSNLIAEHMPHSSFLSDFGSNFYQMAKMKFTSGNGKENSFHKGVVVSVCFVCQISQQWRRKW